MAEPVSTTTDFNLPIDEMIEEAMDTLYGEHTSGYDARSARRSLNLLMIDLINREFPLGLLEKRTFTFPSGIGEATLDSDAIAIIDLNLRDVSTGLETNLEKQSILDYFNIPDKTVPGRPTTYAFDKTGALPKIQVWPIPDTGNYALTYWVVRKHKDITKSYQLADFQFQYLPALTMGLAYFMAFKKDGIDTVKAEWIKMEFEERLERAFAADRDRVDFTVYPVVLQRE